MGKAEISHEAFTEIKDNEFIAKMLMDHAIHDDEEDGNPSYYYRNGFGNGYAGARKIKIILIVQDV